VVDWHTVVDWHAVMQFGGQHLGGLGVPAVAMAFPGYVAQPKCQIFCFTSDLAWSRDVLSLFP
jgi:hypothetical protein